MNLDWARAWFDTFNQDIDVEGALSRYADDVVFEDVIFGEVIRGKEGLRGFFAAFTGPEAGKNTFEVEAYTGGADAGAVQWTWRAVHGGRFLGVEAAGKQTQTRGVSLLTFRDGKIASQTDYWDAAAVLRQLGALSS